MHLLPAFAVAFVALYWSLPLTCLRGRLAIFRFRGARDDMFQWARFLVHFFRADVELVGECGLHRSTAPIIYLHNHRSWADFFLDVYVTEGRAAPLARWAVFPVLPLVLASGRLLRGVLFFNRTRVADKAAFNAWLEARVRSAFVSGVIVYPEGHRSLAPQGLPLKRGMLHFAFERRWPLQIVITSHKEDVLSEKRLEAHWNARLAVGFAEPIRPDDFASDFEAFVRHVQSTWEATWQRVYGHAAGSGRPFEPGEGVELGAAYPPAVLLGQAVVVMLSVALLGALTLLAARIAMSSTFLLTQAAVMAAVTMLSVHAAKL